MSSNEAVYKIRDKETGLFSTGGSVPRWKKIGKTWSGLGPVTNHLTMWCDKYDYKKRKRIIIDIPDEWEIVKYELKEDEAESWAAKKVSDDLKRRQAIHKKYGWKVARAIKELKDVDTEIYHYALVFSVGYDDLRVIRKTFKELGFKRENYRYRSPVVVFNNFDMALAVKMAYGESIERFVDLIELKDIKI